MMIQKKIFNVSEVMEYMSGSVSPFISEREFQLRFSLAIIHKYCELASVSLEYPCNYTIISDETGQPVVCRRGRIDVVVKIDGLLIPIELKYRTKKCTVITEFGDTVELADQFAYDDAGYSFAKDICKVKSFVDNNAQCEEGYCIFLTNDMYYTDFQERQNSYSDFIINTLKSGTRKGKRNGIEDSIYVPDFEYLSNDWNLFEYSQKCKMDFFYKIARVRN